MNQSAYIATYETLLGISQINASIISGEDLSINSIVANTYDLPGGNIGDIISSDATGTFIWSPLSSLAVTSVAGSTGMINVNGGVLPCSGSITLTLPQAISTGSNVVFNEVNALITRSNQPDISSLGVLSGVTSTGSIIAPNYTGTYFIANGISTQPSGFLLGSNPNDNFGVNGTLIPSYGMALGPNSIPSLSGYNGIDFYTADSSNQSLRIDQGGYATFKNKVQTNDLQIVNNASIGYVLQCTDSTGNARWMPATSTGVNSLIGTPNQVICSSTTGNVVLSLPQSIGTSSNVVFNSISGSTLVGTLSTSQQPNISSVGTLTNLSCTGFFTGSTGSFNNTLTTHNIINTSNNTYDIGSAGNTYKSIYGHTSICNGGQFNSLIANSDFTCNYGSLKTTTGSILYNSSGLGDVDWGLPSSLISSSIKGTTNQIQINTGTTGSIIIATPQDINTGSNVTFDTTNSRLIYSGTDTSQSFYAYPANPSIQNGYQFGSVSDYYINTNISPTNRIGFFGTTFSAPDVILSSYRDLYLSSNAGINLKIAQADGIVQTPFGIRTGALINPTMSGSINIGSSPYNQFSTGYIDNIDSRIVSFNACYGTTGNISTINSNLINANTINAGQLNIPSLTLTGTSSSGISLTLIDSYGANTEQWNITQGGSTIGPSNFQIASSSNTGAMFIGLDHRFGFNTNTPSCAFDMHNEYAPVDFPTMKLSTTDSKGQFGVFLDLNASNLTRGNNWRIFSSSNNSSEPQGGLYIYRDASSGAGSNMGLSISATGNVGIHNKWPNYTLDCSGTINGHDLIATSKLNTSSTGWVDDLMTYQTNQFAIVYNGFTISGPTVYVLYTRTGQNITLTFPPLTQTISLAYITAGTIPSALRPVYQYAQLIPVYNPLPSTQIFAEIQIDTAGVIKIVNFANSFNLGSLLYFASFSVTYYCPHD